jgi:hypothetical protein
MATVFKVEVPRKRQRNTLLLAQAMGLALKPRKINRKRRRKDKHPKPWTEEA